MSITISLATIQFSIGMVVGMFTGFSIGYLIYLNKGDTPDED